MITYFWHQIKFASDISITMLIAWLVCKVVGLNSDLRNYKKYFKEQNKEPRL